jgi:hypothetical protein
MRRIYEESEETVRQAAVEVQARTRAEAGW